MSDRIAVIDKGVCAQCDAPEALFRRPRTRFVAQFFRGCNVLEAGCVAVAGGTARLTLAGREVAVPLDGRALEPGRPAAVALRAEAPVLGPEARGCEVAFDAAAVRDVVYRGTSVDHHLELPDGQRLLVTATRRRVAGDAATVPLGFAAADLVPLED